MVLLERALSIAIQAHADKKDRYGRPYILHPLRVMMRFKREEEQITAVLHDVVEDSHWTVEDLVREGFEKTVTDAVDCLSKRKDEPYPDYIERVRSSPLAIRVKIADLEDNMDVRRAPSGTAVEEERLRRYHDAWARLRREMD